jgi:hypothetical protein
MITDIKNIQFKTYDDTVYILTALAKTVQEPIEDEVLINEYKIAIETMLPDYFPFDTFMVQYTEDQHMDKPRIVVKENDIIRILYLEDVEITYPDFYLFLVNFKQEIINYLNKE